MGRVTFYRNVGVFVWDERGSPHHLPHAHVYRRGQRLASVFLLSLEFFNEVDRIPRDVVEKIKDEQQSLLAGWVRLNGD